MPPAEEDRSIPNPWFAFSQMIRSADAGSLPARAVALSWGDAGSAGAGPPARTAGGRGGSPRTSHRDSNRYRPGARSGVDLIAGCAEILRPGNHLPASLRLD